ncbi:DUF397 domain-containing protein [Nocardia caishijiensis]|uniref:Uncharacterized protein DUF397 n=1 Tax=Nocardia caishijiensis TaxID=184756 RepID=A0ABQ6YUH4_9NOCA|nr:DUF397 domain-containing protein [Nocardia caishijiensis]KAF0849448.1 uncharacterized protein DUF397 [Nocardia caishijiensis]
MSFDLVDAHWFKSTRSSANKDCVEVAFLFGGRVGVRDSKNPAGPALVFDGPSWDAFTRSIDAGVLA